MLLNHKLDVIKPQNIICDKSYMDKEQAFEIVAKIVHDRGVELIVGGNPAFETEFVLFYIESTMLAWGYKNPKVAAYCDAIKAENDNFRAMGIC
jgi:hypothetical protein